MFALINLVQMLSLRLSTPLTRRLQSERGATAVEYGLMVAAIAAVIIALVFTIGTNVQAAFQTVCTQLNGGVAC